jgi:DNA helicase-2/ATP-dependent DNA helicase PcrA
MIAPQLERYRHKINDAQYAIISHTLGPLLVIAGPGSGKTHSLTLLALNLLLCGHAKPSELILCTYTEKATYEMQDRISRVAKEINYTEDVSELRIGTIHEICNQFIADNIHHSPLGKDYEILEQFTQQLFIFEHFDAICLPASKDYFFKRWGSQWNVAKNLQGLFDRIAEELIFDKLKADLSRIKLCGSEQDKFLYYLLHAYNNYKAQLVEANRIDFAHQQKWAYDLLQNPDIFTRIAQKIRYILVDEYQDTSYIQEQIITKLALGTGTNNLCVVGDEDQSLYRFRGATVRNILEFRRKFMCEPVYLTQNYRSHPDIIHTYNRWMQSIDWRNPTPGEPAFRTDKEIQPASTSVTSAIPAYPAVVTLTGITVDDEAEQLAELIVLLKAQRIIADYNEVAILLYSVQSFLSAAYIAALKKRGISTFCPRSRKYFEQEEVCLIVGCFVYLLGYRVKAIVQNDERDDFRNYLDGCLKKLTQVCSHFQSLKTELRTIASEIASTTEPSTAKGLADYFYRLIFTPPLAGFLNNENQNDENKRQRQNLVIFSQLLQTFQNYYGHTAITSDKVVQIWQDFFQTFLHLLYAEGFNEYEDKQEPFPKGHVPVLTIHQAKGLEFPVVVVGRMDRLSQSDSKQPIEEKYLQKYYDNRQGEPEHLIPVFDQRRKYYVAFSRAEHVLIMTAYKKPEQQFSALWEDRPVWPNMREDVCLMPQNQKPKEYIPPKRRFSFVGHFQTYKTCPRRFQFFREYNFKPSHSVEAFFGQLVHQTIERVHRHILDRTGDLETLLQEQQLHALFEKTLTFLQRSQRFSMDDFKPDQAFNQVLNYVFHNREEMQTIQEAEYNVKVEKDNYILTGTIDLLRTYHEGLEVLDFKTTSRLEEDSDWLRLYQQQLYIYAHALERRTGKLPERLSLYWTAEARKEDALMVIPYQHESVEQVSFEFDEIVSLIQQKQFQVKVPPTPKICRGCDIRHLCMKEGIIQPVYSPPTKAIVSVPGRT